MQVGEEFESGVHRGIDNSTLEAVAELTQLNDLALSIRHGQSTMTGHGFSQILCSCVCLERVPILSDVNIPFKNIVFI